MGKNECESEARGRSVRYGGRRPSDIASLQPFVLSPGPKKMVARIGGEDQPANVEPDLKRVAP